MVLLHPCWCLKVSVPIYCDGTRNQLHLKKIVEKSRVKLSLHLFSVYRIQNLSFLFHRRRKVTRVWSDTRKSKWISILGWSMSLIPRDFDRWVRIKLFLFAEIHRKLCSFCPWGAIILLSLLWLQENEKIQGKKKKRKVQDWPAALSHWAPAPWHT